MPLQTGCGNCLNVKIDFGRAEVAPVGKSGITNRCTGFLLRSASQKPVSSAVRRLHKYKGEIEKSSIMLYVPNQVEIAKTF